MRKRERSRPDLAGLSRPEMRGNEAQQREQGATDPVRQMKAAHALAQRVGQLVELEFDGFKSGGGRDVIAVHAVLEGHDTAFELANEAGSGVMHRCTFRVGWKGRVSSSARGSELSGVGHRLPLTVAPAPPDPPDVLDVVEPAEPEVLNVPEVNDGAPRLMIW